jgi:hypothetical protein
VQVADGNGGTDTITVNVTIQAVNDAPVLNPIGNKSINESVLLSFSATATDPDANTLTYSLVGAPSGAQIDSAMGAFTWTPAEAQGPGNYPFDICVSDGSLNDCETITVTVNEVNVAPVLDPVGNKSVAKNVLLSFTVTATDSDIPVNTLTYSLVGAPSGADINPTTGVFTWTPTETQANNDYTFDVCVSDGLVSDCETITVTVTEFVETHKIFMPMVTKSP